MSSNEEKPPPHRMVKWSPPYRREHVEQPQFDLVHIERDGPVARIVPNSPHKPAKLLELDEEVRVLIIKGQGPCFSAGYDITPVKKGERQRNMPPGGYIHPERDRLWQSYDLEHARVYMTLFDLQKPVIAQIHGACLAGATELAGFCDLRVVADDAKIGWPVGRNWSPGNLQYIPWLVGMTRAKYYMFTCEPMSGKEAFEGSWASESVPADRLEERTEELARQIALTPTDLIMLTKRSINRQFEVIYSRKSRDLRDGGDEFIARSQRDGLKAALAWRERTFGNRYRDDGGDDGPDGNGD
jgi:enoyl-CoA hydratase